MRRSFWSITFHLFLYTLHARPCICLTINFLQQKSLSNESIAIHWDQTNVTQEELVEEFKLQLLDDSKNPLGLPDKDVVTQGNRTGDVVLMPLNPGRYTVKVVDFNDLQRNLTGETEPFEIRQAANSTSSPPVMSSSQTAAPTISSLPDPPSMSSFTSIPPPIASDAAPASPQAAEINKSPAPIIASSVVGGVVLLLLLLAGVFIYRRRANSQRNRAISFYQDKMTRPPTSLSQHLYQDIAIETPLGGSPSHGSTENLTVDTTPVPRFSGSLTDRQMEIRELIFTLQKQKLSLVDETGSDAQSLKARLDRLEEMLNEDWALGRTDEHPGEMV